MSAVPSGSVAVPRNTPETPAMTVAEIWRTARQRIDALDARLLLQHVAGSSHAQLIAAPERTLVPQQVSQLTELVERRASGEPLAYLLGTAGFYGLEFQVTPAVLIPRPETERLVELALQRLADMKAPRVLDLGTGSGIVAITLARHRPYAHVVAVDLSAAAFDIARHNAARHDVEVEFLLGDWYAPVKDRRFELIVANPPYVADADPHLQNNGLPYEPSLALTGSVTNTDGLACLRKIVEDAPAHLVPGGQLLLEHGYNQAQAMRNLLNENGFEADEPWLDLNGTERVSGGRRANRRTD